MNILNVLIRSASLGQFNAITFHRFYQIFQILSFSEKMEAGLSTWTGNYSGACIGALKNPRAEPAPQEDPGAGGESSCASQLQVRDTAT